jgi:hypothetical protein
MSDHGWERDYVGPGDPDPERRQSVTARIQYLLMSRTDRWWSLFEIGERLRSRSAPRRAQEIFEADRERFKRDGTPREYEERKVPNESGISTHKEFRYVTLARRTAPPPPPALF